MKLALLERLALKLWGRIPKTKKLKDELLKERREKEEREMSFLSRHLKSTSKFD